MDKLKKRVLPVRFSRSGTDDSTSSSATRRSEDDKGALGLNLLYAPPEGSQPVVDMVFVHGLGGGSRKTWSKTSDPAHYWPQAWLSNDTDFSADVRIHSFGYKADWSERAESVLGVHDFAQSLLGELKHSPELIRDPRTRIILVGHSMGGCVVKKTYILANQDPTCAELLARFHSIFFLGTPHRGSNLAATLENMLVVAVGRKPFVKDLTPNSQALSEINDAFRHYAPALRLWSFYETLPVKANIFARIVVEKYSATLGYHNEEISEMNADHRTVCKFADETDPNYKKLRNALAAAVKVVRTELSPRQPSREDRNRVRTFLKASDAPEDDLENLKDLKQPGSCQWIVEREYFSTWKLGLLDAPQILCLTGKPGAGKSVLSSHVIDHLESQGLHCSYFFFKRGASGKSTLSECFRSIANQMSAKDDAVFERLVWLQGNQVTWDETDEKVLWRKVFLSDMFKSPTWPIHYWVIDGLDECVDYKNISALLPKLPPNFRLFATSRHLPQISLALGPRACEEIINDSDSIDDIKLFIQESLSRLSYEYSEKICPRILEKSGGSFLWVRLVLQKIEEAYTHEDVVRTLEEVPADLHGLYKSLVESIEADPSRSRLAEPILRWVVLSQRPLTVTELRCVVGLELGLTTIASVEKALPNICGHLVFVDQSGVVRVIHETVREFLSSQTLNTSTIIIHPPDGNTQIAKVLLRYLKGSTYVGAGGSTKKAGFMRPDRTLSDYACGYFSVHFSHADVDDSELVDELTGFLKLHVLSWVEAVARNGDLEPINRASQSFRTFLDRRARLLSLAHPSFTLMNGWATDLARVATKFRGPLLEYPASIHHLIPALCPTEATISRTLRPRSNLVVCGHRRMFWDGLQLRIDFPHARVTAVTHGVRYFAVGLSSGQISLYNAVSLQQMSNFNHSEIVRFLEFSPGDQHLVSSGGHEICVWDVESGAKTHTISGRNLVHAICFLSPDDLMYVLERNEIVTFCLETQESQSLYWGTDHLTLPESSPRIVVFSPPEVGLLALGFRGHPIFILDTSSTIVAQVHGPPYHNNGIDTMLFSPNPDVSVLAISYSSGRLVLFDWKTKSCSTMAKAYAHTLSFTRDGRILAARTASGTMDFYELEEDLSLTPIYRISNLDEGLRKMSFSSDGRRLVEAGQTSCHIWELESLTDEFRNLRDTSDFSSESERLATLAERRGQSMDDDHDGREITALACHPSGDWIICGNTEGGVRIHLTRGTKSKPQQLYAHAEGCSIVAAAVAVTQRGDLVATADDASKVRVGIIGDPQSTNPSRLSSAAQQTRMTVIPLFNKRFDSPISKILIHSSGNRLLVCGFDKLDQLWEVPSGSVLCRGSWPGDLHLEAGGQIRRTVIQHHSHPDLLLEFSNSNTEVRLLTWDSLAEVSLQPSPRYLKQPDRDDEGRDDASKETGISRANEIRALSRKNMVKYQLELGATRAYYDSSHFVVEQCGASNGRPGSLLECWNVHQFEPAAASQDLHAAGSSHPPPNSDAPSVDRAAAASELLIRLGPVVFFVVAIHESTLFFVDLNLWICSVDLLQHHDESSKQSGHPAPLRARRHFFALPEWRSAMKHGGSFQGGGGQGSAQRLGCAMTSRKVFAFPAGNRLVVICNGLNPAIGEDVVLDPSPNLAAATEQGSGSYPDRILLNTRHHLWTPISAQASTGTSALSVAGDRTEAALKMKGVDLPWRQIPSAPPSTSTRMGELSLSTADSRASGAGDGVKTLDGATKASVEVGVTAEMSGANPVEG